MNCFDTYCVKVKNCFLFKLMLTAPVCVHAVCVCTLDGLIVEHKFRVWVTILGRMSLSLSKLVCVTLRGK